MAWLLLAHSEGQGRWDGVAWEGKAYDNGSAACNGDGGDDIHGKMTFSGRLLGPQTMTSSPSLGCED